MIRDGIRMIEISPFFGQILTPIVTIFRRDSLPLFRWERAALRAAGMELSRTIINIDEVYRNNSPKRHCSLLPMLANPRVRFVRLGNTG